MLKFLSLLALFTLRPAAGPVHPARVPMLSITGSRAIGTTLTFDVQLPGPGNAFLLVGTQLGPTVLKRVTLDISLVAQYFVFPLATQATGAASLDVDLPLDTNLVGLTFYGEALELGTPTGPETSGATAFTVAPALPLTNLYVNRASGDDANDGSLGSPWRSIQRAADLATPGSLVHIAAGVYPERVVFHVSGDASAGPIVFQGDPAGGSVLDGSGFTNADFNNWSGAFGLGLIDITDRSYLHLLDLEVHGLHTASTNHFLMGVHVAHTQAAPGGMRGIELLRLDVHDIRYTGSSDQGGAQGIAFYGGSTSSAIEDVLIEACEVHDLRLGQSESVTLNGNIDGFQVIGNSVHDNDNIGIVCIGWEGTAGGSSGDDDSDANAHLYGGHNPLDRVRNGLITQNLVFRCSTEAPVKNPTYPQNDFSAAGIYIDGARDLVIERNEVFECDLGVAIGSEHGGLDSAGGLRDARGVVARSNVLYYCGQTGIELGGYNAFRGPAVGCEILANTIYKCASLGYGGGQILFAKNHNNSISGNIFVARGLADNIDYDGLNNSGPDWIFDHGVVISSNVGAADNFGDSLLQNLYFTQGGPSSIYWKWQQDDSIDPTQGLGGLLAIDASGQYANPGFVQASLGRAAGNEDFRLLSASSPAKDAGLSSSPNLGARDFDGNQRIAAPEVDQGAFEFGSQP